MDRAELREEFKERGFEHLSEARANRIINDAYLLDICEEEDWPFLEASKEGKAPLEIEDLRTVEYIIDTTQERKLFPMRRARLTDDWDVDLTTVGTPEAYYLSQTAGVRIVNVYPTSTTDTLLVRYFKTADELSTDESEPLAPKRFHSVIVDFAQARAYRGTDNWDTASSAAEVAEEHLQTMRDALLNLQHDAPDDYVVLAEPGSR